ncbi:MAG: NAD(P)-binding protein, partial [Agathobacter sp.]|nr:NAD(P)-binding protein [Agathobacter sp.]
MIRISQLKLSVFHDERELTDKIRKTLKLSKNEAFSYEIKKRSIDARKKPDLYYVYSLNVKVKEEDKILKRVHSNSVISIEEKEYEIPNCGEKPMNYKPVIIGAGPAGLFCSYLLALQGYKPIVIERGKRVEERQLDVEEFWKTGILNPSSNVQFGEGGAGTFSDGKLNTAVK